VNPRTAILLKPENALLLVSILHSFSERTLLFNLALTYYTHSILLLSKIKMGCYNPLFIPISFLVVYNQKRIISEFYF